MNIPSSIAKKKILIIRFSSIGDIVLTSPVIRCIKLQTAAQLHFLTKLAYASLLEANPYVDQIFSIQKDIKEVIGQLQAEQYDHIIDLHNNLRSWQVSRALNAPVARFRKLNLEKWLLVNFKIDRLPNLHIVDRYLATAASLGVQNDGAGLDYYVPKEAEVTVTISDTTIQVNKKTKPQLSTTASPIAYIAYAIGGTHSTKCLPTEKIIRLVNQITQPLILLGGPSDAQKGATIVEQAQGQVFNACGQLSIHESASIIRQAQLVISHDTGMMHIAAALHKRIISIWGNTVPAFGMYPYYPKDMDRNTSIQVTGLKCRPCSKIGYTKCPKGHFNCMQQIDEQAVLKAIE